MKEIFEFYWPVPANGFEWRDLRGWPDGPNADPFHDKYLVARSSPNPDQGRRFPVFKKTGLFRTFADVEITEGGVAGFANNYGFLGVPIRVDHPIEGVNNAFQLVKGETFSTWHLEIERMREAVELWESCKETSTAGESSGDVDAHWERLRNLVNDALLMPAGNPKKRAADPKLFWERHAGNAKVRLRFVPRTLLSALWVQFAIAIEGDRRHAQCEQCATWFEVAAEKREDAKFCSNACRFRAYRARQKEARKLYARGNSIKQIAAEIGSDIRAVSGWVKEK